MQEDRIRARFRELIQSIERERMGIEQHPSTLPRLPQPTRRPRPPSAKKVQELQGYADEIGLSEALAYVLASLDPEVTWREVGERLRGLSRRPQTPLRRAAKVLGLPWVEADGTPFAWDTISLEIPEDLRPPDHFECPECGRWAGVEEAAELRAASIASLALDSDEWDLVLDRARTSSIRALVLERDLGKSHEDATSILKNSERLGLLRAQKNGYVAADARCGPCYERRAQTVAMSSKSSRDPIPAQLRFRVLQRDSFRCQYCGRSARDGATLHLDHVVPYAAGGETSEDNLLVACEQCNLGKRDNPVIHEEPRGR